MYDSPHKFRKDLKLGFFKIRELYNSAAYRGDEITASW